MYRLLLTLLAAGLLAGSCDPGGDGGDTATAPGEDSLSSDTALPDVNAPDITQEVSLPEDSIPDVPLPEDSIPDAPPYVEELGDIDDLCGPDGGDWKPELVCCYPCGIPGCQWKCATPCDEDEIWCDGGCPMLP